MYVGSDGEVYVRTRATHLHRILTTVSLTRDVYRDVCLSWRLSHWVRLALHTERVGARFGQRRDIRSASPTAHYYGYRSASVGQNA